VPAVAAGYFWDPAAASGSGAAGFLLPEGNGKTAYNMIAASAAVAPSLATINGQAVVFLANGAPDKSARVAGNVTRGFTGATMIWGWISAPGPNVGIVVHHGRAVSLWMLQLNTSDVRGYVFDGTSGVESRFTNPTYASAPYFYELVFDPAQSATNRISLFVDRVQLTPAVAGSPGTALADTADVMGLCAQAGDSSNFNLNGDVNVGLSGITNGLPSSTERDQLFAYKRLK
jgi:hypothetical protein